MLQEAPGWGEAEFTVKSLPYNAKVIDLYSHLGTSAHLFIY